MPKTINGQEVMTSQEWMRLGYPVFVAAALEAMNTDAAENPDEGNSQVTPEGVGSMTTTDIMAAVLEWEGIIGYADNIVEAVRGLDKLKEQNND